MKKDKFKDDKIVTDEEMDVIKDILDKATDKLAKETELDGFAVFYSKGTAGGAIIRLNTSVRQTASMAKVMSDASKDLVNNIKEQVSEALEEVGIPSKMEDWK